MAVELHCFLDKKFTEHFRTTGTILYEKKGQVFAIKYYIADDLKDKDNILQCIIGNDHDKYH